MSKSTRYDNCRIVSLLVTSPVLSNGGKLSRSGHYTMSLVRLEPGTSRSQVEHFTTEPVYSPSSGIVFSG